MRTRLSIRTLILLMGLLPVMALCLGFGLLAVNAQMGTINQLMDDRARTSAALFAKLTPPLLAENNHRQLAQLGRALMDSPGIEALAVYDGQRQLVLQSGASLASPSFALQVVTSSPDRPWHNTTTLSHPVYAPGDAQHESRSAPIGWVQLGFHDHQYQLHKYQSMLISSLAITSALIIAIGLSLYINLRLNQDTKSIRNALRSLIANRRDFHLSLPGNDRFNEIANLINQLNHSHQQALEELEIHVSQGNTDLHETLETLEVQNIELDLARKEAVKANRIKSEFLANTSHELRTPLNAIIGFSNMVLKTDLNNRQHQSLESIRNAADSLLTIINDILDFSKLEADKLVLDKGPVNLRDVIEESLSLQAPAAQEKQLILIANIDSDVPTTVESDALRLKQIFTNLISNAIKFTHRGHIEVRLSCVERHEQHTTLQFQVCDTGIGLSRKQQHTIFRDFGQVDASVTRQYGGTGLGLAIVRRLIQEMHGEIGVESDIGQGAIFWFTLPLEVSEKPIVLRPFQKLAHKSLCLFASQALQADALLKLLDSWSMQVSRVDSPEQLNSDCDYRLLLLDYHQQPGLDAQLELENTVLICPNPADYPQGKAVILASPYSHTQLFDALDKGVAARTSSRQFSGKTVLLVDDNPANLLFLQDALADFSIITETAQNGPEAINHCQSRCYDLILMDVQMPQLDGIAASAAIRQQGQNRHTPIILVTAHLAPENPMQLRQAGVDGFISKPVTENQLIGIFDRFLVASDDKDNAPAASTPPPIPPVDIDGCLSMAKQRPQFAVEMLEMLMAELPEQIAALQRAQQDNDWDTAGKLAHHLKGACCYTSVPLLKAALLEFEGAIADLGDRDAALQGLITEARNLLNWRQQYELNTVFGLD